MSRQTEPSSGAALPEDSAALKEIIAEQLDLWRLSSYVSTHGPTKFKEELLEVLLPDAKLRTSQLISMGAAQSANTLLACSHWKGIRVRDLYPIARSCIESFINAAYLLAEDNAVAERAVRWIEFRAWKHMHRGGKHTLRHKSMGKPVEEMPDKYAEFRAFKDSDWCSLKVPERAERVLTLVGPRAGLKLLTAYDLIYPVSSEVIHGSPFGTAYFYHGYAPAANATAEDFVTATQVQYADMLVAVSHAASGYLNAFFKLNFFRQPFLEEQHLFNRLLANEGVDAHTIIDLEPSANSEGKD